MRGVLERINTIPFDGPAHFESIDSSRFTKVKPKKILQLELEQYTAPKSLKLIKIDFLKYSRIYDRNVQNRVSTQHHTEATIKSGDES